MIVFAHLGMPELSVVNAPFVSRFSPSPCFPSPDRGHVATDECWTLRAEEQNGRRRSAKVRLKRDSSPSQAVLHVESKGLVTARKK